MVKYQEDPMEEAKQLKEKGNAMYKKGEFGGAIELYLKAAELHKEDFPVYYSNIHEMHSSHTLHI